MFIPMKVAQWCTKTKQFDVRVSKYPDLPHSIRIVGPIEHAHKKLMPPKPLTNLALC